MNWKCNICLAAALLILCNCRAPETPSESFFHKTSEQWNQYLEEIEIMSSDLSHRILLITYPTTCPPCLNELLWWNQERENFDNLEITLIVLENYESTYHAFLETNHFKLPAYRDSAGLIFEHELIGYPPVKIYFNKEAKITAIERIGTNGNLSAFLDKIENK